MNEPRPATISALPLESRSSVANAWNTRTGSAALRTVTALVRRIRGEQTLVAHSGHLHLRQHQTQLLDRARAAGAAVADEAGRFVGPLCKQKIDRVLERAGGSMVVLGRDENVCIEAADLSGPRFGVRFTVLPHYGRHGLVEERQVEIFDVHELELGVAAFFRHLIDPLCYCFAISIRARASNNDCDLKHKFLLDGF